MHFAPRPCIPARLRAAARGALARSGLVALALLGLAACGGGVRIDDPGGGGAGGSGSSATSSSTGASCQGSTPHCALGCGSDYFPERAECVGGRWVCPPGTVLPQDCSPGTCWGAPLACEVCDGGWDCRPTPQCIAGCGGIVCASCSDDGPFVDGACTCTCQGGAFVCAVTPGCCRHDRDCGDDNVARCVSGVCKEPVSGGCWSTDDCSPGERCEGASVCPCGADCILEDRPGTCITS